MLLLFLTSVAVSMNATAETEASADAEMESFNMAGYVILGFALIGWAFFLYLLGWAILQIVKKAKNPYIAKNPVKCK
tara:strand:- start:402 stop:632 length:231 start_codon:yes stop_codon:yes gene_type:complete